MTRLVLEPLEIRSAGRWRWLLRTESGEALASHEVELVNGDYEYRGFADLYRFLRWEADPERRVVSETELAARVGTWIGEHALGPEVMAALLDEAPVTVRMVVPEGLAFLPYRPWELAKRDGRVLGREQVRFVFDLMTSRQRAHAVQGEARRSLRILALFSLPIGGSVLGLRRERYALDQLIRQIAQGEQPRAVELKVLQYGVTRDALTAAVDDGDGWDVLHVSGHGGAGTLLLEQSDGTADPVSPEDLVELLYPMRHRLRLAVLSACESGAATAAEILRMLDLAEQATGLSEQADAEAEAPSGSSGPGENAGWAGLGRTLVEKLGCAVLAMRYPVVDDFAIELGAELYRGIFERGLSVDVALARALPRAAHAPPSIGAPAASLATPALLGPATDLRLEPPVGRVQHVSLAMAGFPREPTRFVGRTGTLAQARYTLLPASGRATVILHGMAGAGKTTAALELAYQTKSTFTAAAFWVAPPAAQWQSALSNLAMSLEMQLNPGLNPDQRSNVPTLQLVGNTGTDSLLAAYLPRLTELVEQYRLLVVLDNLETLLTADGAWLDPRFGRVVAALADHAGASRLVLTSRVLPVDLDPALVTVLPVHALSRNESLLLARELPNLRALQHDTEPVTRAETAAREHRALLARTLTIVQGHPKLLELADAAAADPEVLAVRVAAAEAAAAQRGTPLAAFLETGESEADPEHLLAALVGWTRTATRDLDAVPLLLLQLLAAMEPDHRDDFVVREVWQLLWKELGREGTPPALPDVLTKLSTALIEPIAFSRSGGESIVRFRIHPGIADTIRTDTPENVLAAVDEVVSYYWAAVFVHAQQREEADASGWLVVHAAQAAAPYLLRRDDWDTLAVMIEQAVHRDRSPSVIAAVLPYLEALVRAASGSDDELRFGALCANVVALVDPARGERELRDIVARAISNREHRVGATCLGRLIDLLHETGRTPEGLVLVEQMRELDVLANVGPWTRLATDGRRLQLLLTLGDVERVLDEVNRAREHMRDLQATGSEDEAVKPWNVHETTLDTGRRAACELRRWDDALEIGAEILASKQRRGASEHDVARSAFNEYAPLIRLGRFAEADRLLRSCHDVFERAGDAGALGRVFSARADLVDEQGDAQAAARHEMVALRYAYDEFDPRAAAVSHHNLATYLGKIGRLDAGVAHAAGAALIRHLTGLGANSQTELRVLARAIAYAEPELVLPTTIERVRDVVEQVEGARLGALLDALQPDLTQQQAALDAILDMARAMSAEHRVTLADHVAEWDPVLADIANAVASGDPAWRQDLEERISTSFRDDPDWCALSGRLLLAIAGERDPDVLAADLDAVDAAIVSRLLDRLAGRVADDESEGLPD